VTVDFRRFPSPDDLLILLTVARLGRFNAVAEALDTTHTTISRRMAALDKKLGGRTLERSPQGWELTDLGREAVRAAEVIEGGLDALTTSLAHDTDALSGLVRVSTTDGFGAHIVTPALVKLQNRHPRLTVEIISATRKLNQNRSGVDLEIVAGRIDASKAQTIFLTNYFLRLYATAEYLALRGTPQTIDDVKDHTFVSYVESVLQVAELGYRSLQLPVPAASFQSTSIFAQIEAVRRHSGIGLLPSFMVCNQPEFVRVLPDGFERQLPFYAAARTESLSSAAVKAVIAAILREVRERQGELAA